MGNPLFDYSPIVRRSLPALPHGARVAVWIGLNIEHYQFGRPSLSLANFTAELVPDPLNHGWRDYGPRVGIWRLIEIFDRLAIRPTAIVNSEVCARYPEIVEQGVERGWTWVAHGRDNSTWQTGMERDDERTYIEEVVATIEAATGRRPAGWLGPALTATMNTNDLLAELGLSYALDWANDDQPYDFNVRSGRLISVPYSSELNDIPAFLLHHHTGRQFAEAIVDGVAMLAAEGASRPRVLGIGIHPFLVGQPFRAEHFARALEALSARDDVWLTTADDIATWYLSGAQPEPGPTIAVDGPEARLAALGLDLPSVVPPVGQYVRAVQTGNLLFCSGHLPDSAGEPIHLGKLGRDLTTEQGRAAARQAAVNLLGTVRSALGSLDRVRRIVKLLGMVNSTEDYVEQPLVMNGASELLHDVLGDRAIHARSAVGMAQLPRNNCVEIEAIVEVAAD